MYPERPSASNFFGFGLEDAIEERGVENAGDKTLLFIFAL
jgi:hypothetical protein